MFVKILIVLAVVYYVGCNDLNLGHPSSKSRVLLSETRHARAESWVRTDTIRIDAPKGEIISGVIIKDLREDKKGIAYVESGGVSQHFVTIGLRSADSLKGFRFRVDVYSEPLMPAKILPFYKPERKITTPEA